MAKWKCTGPNCDGELEFPDRFTLRGKTKCPKCQNKTVFDKVADGRPPASSPLVPQAGPAAPGESAGALPENAPAAAPAGQRPARAADRFFVRQGYCGFIFNRSFGTRFLTTSGISTCVGFMLFDQRLGSGGLAHFDDENETDSGAVVQAMVQTLEASGSNKADLKAYVVWSNADDSTTNIRTGIDDAVRTLNIPCEQPKGQGGDDVALNLETGDVISYREVNLRGTKIYTAEKEEEGSESESSEEKRKMHNKNLQIVTGVKIEITSANFELYKKFTNMPPAGALLCRLKAPLVDVSTRPPAPAE